MFLAGIVSILAAFAGYVQSGGGEELLRRALATVTSGNATFKSLEFNWQDGEMVVTNLHHEDYQYKKDESIASFTGIEADKIQVKMDLYPWPPDFTRIVVHGIKTAITVSEGFLLSEKLPQKPKTPPIPPIEFRDCDLKLTIGGLQPLELTGCSGELRMGRENELRGTFSLKELNGKPFNFKLELLEDGRWVFTGDEIQIDTVALKAKTNLFAGKFDPVGLLVRALFSGEMGARGTLTSMHIVLQPATAQRKFVCDGEVSYRNLEFKLPPAEQEAGQAVPFFLGQLIGTDESQGESPWPRWMQVDRIKTGDHGRVAFRMAEGRLDFSANEGPGSTFTGIRKDHVFPPLEALSGSVETDSQGRPKRVVLRGFLGEQLSFETRIDRGADRSRTYELVLEPRAGDSNRIVFGKPLWRFSSRVQDYPKRGPDMPMLDFEIEGDARHFPYPEWLPPGMTDLAGHLYAKGQFRDTDSILHFDMIRLDDGASLAFGGSEDESKSRLLWKAVHALFPIDPAWSLRDLSMGGRADVHFGQNLKLDSIKLDDWTLTSGTISYAGRTTNFAVTPLSLHAHYQESEVSDSNILLTAAAQALWKVSLIGNWKSDLQHVTGGIKFIEQDVPLPLYPQSGMLDSKFISDDRRRVNRETEIVIENNRLHREVRP